MKRLAGLAIVFSIMLFIGSISAWSDEVESEIQRGLSAYKAQEYSKAIKSLEYASQQIRQLKAERIGQLFPAALPGWISEEPQSAAIGPIFMGGAISASRIYRKDGETVKIEIVSDSPLISFVTGLLSNPMIAAASPAFNITRIKGQDAVLEWDDRDQDGTIKIVVDNKVLITVSGTGCQKDDLFTYADAIDYNKIRSSVSN